MNFSVTNSWIANYPNAAMGVLLVEGIDNSQTSEDLEKEKAALMESLRERYISRDAIKADSTLQAYARYYKHFKKNYHVFFQVESVAVKGKPIPSVNPLVEAMFMAELKFGLLTAGHDFDRVRGAAMLDAAMGDETYVTMNGEEKTLKPGDMYVCDADGILSSIIYGPDQRTRITKNTNRALFSIYAVEGIQKHTIATQMQEMAAWMRLFSPAMTITHMEIYPAN